MLKIVPLLLTSFISVNGQLVPVEENSQEALNYAANVVTDIGVPVTESTEELNVESTEEVIEELTETEEELLPEIDLLAETSVSVTGAVNTTVLGLMDRIIDGYPDDYEYAGFRVDSDDSYRATLYISRHGKKSGDSIVFGDDCIAIDFYRYSISGYSSYIYYDIVSSPDAVLDVSEDTIVYTNVLDGAPSLGTRMPQSSENIWLGFFALGMLMIFLRRKNHA